MEKSSQDLSEELSEGLLLGTVEHKGSFLTAEYTVQ